MNEKLSCEIVRDLIPLCSEGLCSEESRAAIEAHVKDCEGCRKLFAQLPEVTAPESTVPDEGKAFRKVRKKLKRGKLKIAALSVVLVILLGGLGYLTIGQITKQQWSEWQSFETVWQTIEVRRLAKMIAKGELDAYIEYASAGDLLDSYVSPGQLEILREQDKENCNAAFQAAFGDDEVERIKVKSFYVGRGQLCYSVVDSRAEIYYKSGKQLEIDFIKGEDGLYRGCVMTIGYGGNEEGAALHFREAFNFIDTREIYPMGMLGHFLSNDAPVDAENAKVKTRFLANRMRAAYQEDIEERLNDFYAKGYLIRKFDVTEVRFDKETEMLYHDVTVAAEDRQGSAVLTTRLYVQYDGMIPAPEFDRLYTDGCTDKLAEDLDALLG